MKHLLLTTFAAVMLVETAFTDPIHTAPPNGNLEGIQAESDKGVDVDLNVLDDSASTPLDWVIWSNETEVANQLRKHGGIWNSIPASGLQRECFRADLDWLARFRDALSHGSLQLDVLAIRKGISYQ